MMSRRIGWIGALSLVVGCAGGGAGAKKDGGPNSGDPTLDASDDGGSPDTTGDGDGDGDSTSGDGDSAAGDGDATKLDGGNQGPATDAASGDGDGGDSTQTDGGTSHAAFCSGKGPVIKVPMGSGITDDDNGGVCTGTIARKVFKNALCTCENAFFAGYLQTGTYTRGDDGDITSWGPGGGNVGVNGSYYSGAYTSVGGDLKIFGGAKVEDDWNGLDPSLAAGWVDVWGDLEIADHLAIPGLLTVHGNATVNQLEVAACFIDGTLTQRPDGLFDPAVIGCPMAFTEKKLELEPPCNCKPKDLLDVGAIVQEGKLHNDNDNPAVKLKADELKNLDLGLINVQVREIELPCGRYFLDEISVIGAVRLKITGRTALFVEHDVWATGLFDVDLVGPDAELDLFIGGNLVLTGAMPFGNLNRPQDLRIFVAGNEDLIADNNTIAVTGFAPIGGNIYAPRSNFTSPGYLPLNGSLFVRNFHANGYVQINYDARVLEQGDDESCNPPPPPPPPPGEPPPPECGNKCDEQCGFSQTCIAGECKPCTKNSDCCSPLICYPDGRCGANVL